MGSGNPKSSWSWVWWRTWRETRRASASTAEGRQGTIWACCWMA